MLRHEHLPHRNWQRNRRGMRCFNSATAEAKEFVLAAVQQNGLALEILALEHIDVPATANIRCIIRSAVQQNGLALCLSPVSLRSDPDIVCIVARQNHRAMHYACLELGWHEETAKKGVTILRCALGGFCVIQRHLVFSDSVSNS